MRQTGKEYVVPCLADSSADARWLRRRRWGAYWRVLVGVYLFAGGLLAALVLEHVVGPAQYRQDVTYYGQETAP